MAKFSKNYQKSNTPPNSFSIEVTKPNGEKVIKGNCTLYNGIVVQLASVGRGKNTEKVYWSPEGDADVVEEWEYYAYIPRPMYLTGTESESLKAEIIKLDEACGKKNDYTECHGRKSAKVAPMKRFLILCTGFLTTPICRAQSKRGQKKKSSTAFFTPKTFPFSLLILWVKTGILR